MNQVCKDISIHGFCHTSFVSQWPFIPLQDYDITFPEEEEEKSFLVNINVSPLKIHL